MFVNANNEADMGPVVYGAPLKVVSLCDAYNSVTDVTSKYYQEPSFGRYWTVNTVCRWEDTPVKGAPFYGEILVSRPESSLAKATDNTIFTVEGGTGSLNTGDTFTIVTQSKATFSDGGAIKGSKLWWWDGGSRWGGVHREILVGVRNRPGDLRDSQLSGLTCQIAQRTDKNAVVFDAIKVGGPTAAGHLPKDTVDGELDAVSVACGSLIDGTYVAAAVDLNGKLNMYDPYELGPKPWDVIALKDEKDVALTTPLDSVVIDSVGNAFVNDKKGAVYALDLTKKTVKLLPAGTGNEVVKIDQMSLFGGLVGKETVKDLWAVDLTTQTVYQYNFIQARWVARSGLGVASYVAVGIVAGEKWVLALNNQGRLYKMRSELNADGTAQWQKLLDDELATVVIGDKVYATNKGLVYELVIEKTADKVTYRMAPVMAADGKPVLGISELSCNLAGSIIYIDKQFNVWMLGDKGVKMVVPAPAVTTVAPAATAVKPGVATTPAVATAVTTTAKVATPAVAAKAVAATPAKQTRTAAKAAGTVKAAAKTTTSAAKAKATTAVATKATAKKADVKKAAAAKPATKAAATTTTKAAAKPAATTAKTTAKTPAKAAAKTPAKAAAKTPAKAAAKK
jgi:hypothetical protein